MKGLIVCNYLERSVLITSNVVSSNPAQAMFTQFTTLCYKVYQWLAIDRWFSPVPPVSSTKQKLTTTI